MLVQENGCKSMNKDPVDDDKQLLKHIADGDRQALADLYSRFQRPLFSYLLQLTPDYGLAEELLQDTFIAIWKSAQSFEGRSSVPTWIFSIARRQAHNTLRQRKLPVMRLIWKGWYQQILNPKTLLLHLLLAMN